MVFAVFRLTDAIIIILLNHFLMSICPTRRAIFCAVMGAVSYTHLDVYKRQDLKRAGAKCILGPLLTDRSKIELRNLSFSAPRVLYEAGIKFALMTDHPVIPEHYICLLYTSPSPNLRAPRAGTPAGSFHKDGAIPILRLRFRML